MHPELLASLVRSHQADCLYAAGSRRSGGERPRLRPFPGGGRGWHLRRRAAPYPVVAPPARPRPGAEEGAVLAAVIPLPARVPSGGRTERREAG